MIGRGTPSADRAGDALDRVLPSLRCPVCALALSRSDTVVRCPAGHAFDVARQGYVNLVTGGTRAGTADTAEMVAARERVLASGFLAGVTDAVCSAAVRAAVPGLVVDLAGGTGHHLAAVLDALPTAFGMCLDVSTAALRRAARVHPRAAAVGADTWQPLPLSDGVVGVVLSAFGPRDTLEIRRVLALGGRVVVVTPLPSHLVELRGPLGLLTVHPAKNERLARTFAGFDPVSTAEVVYAVDVGRPAAVDLAVMGPTGKHVDAPEFARRAAALPEPTAVTVAVRVDTYA